MSKRNRKSGRRTGKNNVLPIVGKTNDGKLVVTGVYEFHETYGVPLEDLLDYLNQKDLVVDWVDFYSWAKSNGMKHERIISKIQDPIEDTYGFEYFRKVKEGLDSIWKS